MRSIRDKAVVVAGVVVAVVMTAGFRELRELRQRIDGHDARFEQLNASTPVAPRDPTTAEMTVGDNWQSFGSADAPVTVVEFTDYECPFCRQFHAGAFLGILRNYVADGRVRWVSRDLPLDIHPYASKAAEAARCAGDQGRYWQLRDVFLTSEGEITREVVTRAARRLELNMMAFEHCLDSEKYRHAVAADAADAARLGISGTPTFVISRTAPGKISGRVIIGSHPYRVFESAIDSLLND